MLVSLAVLAIVVGGLLMILGHHSSGQFVVAGIALAVAAPLVDSAMGALLQALNQHSVAIALLLVVMVVGAAAIKIRPRHGSSAGDRPSLKKRVDHDN